MPNSPTTTELVTPAEALTAARRWTSIEDLGRSDLPMLAVDLRGLQRTFRQHNQDHELAELVAASTWVNVAVVDRDLDPAFVELADGFDVLIGDGTDSTVAFDTLDVTAALHELSAAIASSPQAAVALARLLRTSHDLSVAQALHAESLTYAMLQTSERYQQWLAKRAGNETSPTEDEVVGVERTGSLLKITLQRPTKRNALNVAMRDQLAEALTLLDLDTSLDGAILAGAGDNFSAGGDLDEFGSTPSPAMGHHVRMVRSLPALMHRVRERTRVHVHGACVGAGIELPAFASAVIAHPDATFQLPEVGFGLVPGAGGTVSVTRRCGRHLAAWLALTGNTISAEQALRWRLIDRIDERVFT